MAGKIKQKILIVDDSEMNRSILADMLGEEYDIIEAEDGVQAVGILSKQASELSLVLLDIVMPKLDGFGVLGAMNQNGWIIDVPVIMVSAESGSKQVERAYELGVTDFINRPFDALVVRRRVVNTILLYAKQKRLIGMVEDQIYETEQRSSLMIDILSHIVEFRNGESGLHILHVRTLTAMLLELIAARTDKYGLTPREISLISTASALHDVGKIAIDGAILNKPGRLTSEEFSVMKTHTTVGAEMLQAAVPGWMTDEEYDEIMKTHTTAGADMLARIPVQHGEDLVKTAYEICRWHHERWDGRGYPDGLRGDEIPISAQVVSLADVYDALTSPRVYKPAIPHEEALRMILDGQCGQFNPMLLQCLVDNAEKIRTALQGDAAEEIQQRNLRSISEEALRGEGGAVSERTLRLLDYERMKYHFFAAMSEEIQFEYTVTPSMVTLSAYGSKMLGLEEIFMDPLHSEKLISIVGARALEEIVKRQRSSTPDEPDSTMEVLVHLDGESRWFRVITRSVWSKDLPPRYTGLLGKAIDIHEEKMRLRELEKKASCDPLTGLLNRTSAREQIENRMLVHPDGHFALAEIDIDDFKRVNDELGHIFGDRVLQELARRMKHSVRNSDICCRAGGEEFFIFLEYNTDIERTLERIFSNICFELDGRQVTVSVGVALGDDVGQRYEDLYHAADVALYAAKRGGKNRFCFYDETMGDGGTDATKGE